VTEATTPRWTFDGGICDAVCQALAELHYEEDDQMGHSQYRHFPSQAHKGADTMVLPTGHRDLVRCLSDQVKLTRALNEELDRAMKDIHQLDDQGE
jgi:hypothetical protein